ncbi:MAG: phosphoribosylamine--glycine ligase [Patescibacteria group bacterium]
MKVLVIGGGGREHAIIWKIAQSPLKPEIFAAPGNAGIAELATCVPIDPKDLGSLRRYAVENSIDLTIVGPEWPLAHGIVDNFQAARLPIFGFDSITSRLEGSKFEAKKFMERHRISTGQYLLFEDPVSATEAIKAGQPPYVIKADGLAEGKGVKICHTVEEGLAAIKEIMVDRKFGDAGNRILLDEFLQGEEVSVMTIFDGDSYVIFQPSQDHKRALDGDQGENTGGMGAYAPVPFVDSEMMGTIIDEILDPTFVGMQKEGLTGCGTLYFGLILTEEGPKVLEYNVRFGDPETQVILPLFAGDLLEVMLAATEKKIETLKTDEIYDTAASAACVIVASGGYPGKYEKGFPISGLEEAKRTGCLVFHAGTVRSPISEGSVIKTNGGRVVGVTAVKPSLAEAIKCANAGADLIRFDGCFHRTDIGAHALKSLGK